MKSLSISSDIADVIFLYQNLFGRFDIQSYSLYQ